MAIGTIVGTVTVEGSGQPGPEGPIEKVKLSWTSDASGNVSGVGVRVRGKLVNVLFKPGAGGVAPTTLYDVTLLDVAGFDVLSGKGGDRSAIVAQRIAPGVPMNDGTTAAVGEVLVSDDLELVVSNAGAAKQGTVWLYILQH